MPAHEHNAARGPECGPAGRKSDRRTNDAAEECFGWLKTVALLRKVRHRGLDKVDWVFTFACATYNLVRLRNLSMQLG
jgi:hypothetical protein